MRHDSTGWVRCGVPQHLHASTQKWLVRVHDLLIGLGLSVLGSLLYLFLHFVAICRMQSLDLPSENILYSLATKISQDRNSEHPFLFCLRVMDGGACEGCTHFRSTRQSWGPGKHLPLLGVMNPRFLLFPCSLVETLILSVSGEQPRICSLGVLLIQCLDLPLIHWQLQKHPDQGFLHQILVTGNFLQVIFQQGRSFFHQRRTHLSK
mmetsp:Transcript_42514/g.66592  ORF Transcript_42514/g.66592 Transcript_42514/m.66592 type:complete len:207 (+) Transcript_42514:1358-1978(+)